MTLHPLTLIQKQFQFLLQCQYQNSINNNFSINFSIIIIIGSFCIRLYSFVYNRRLFSFVVAIINIVSVFFATLLVLFIIAVKAAFHKVKYTL